MQTLTAQSRNGIPLWDEVLGPALELLETPVWVQELSPECFYWLNAAALRLWRADSLAELRDRRVHASPSPANIANLQRIFAAAAAGETFAPEIRTYYPKGETVNVELRRRGMLLPTGAAGVLTEVTRIFDSNPMQERNANALFATPFVIGFFRPDGTPLQLNPAAQATYGAESNLFQRCARSEDAERMRQDLAGKAARFRDRITVLTRTGERWHDVDVRRWHDEHVGSDVYLSSEIDVTDIKDAELAAIRANNIKTDFLANVSHELRTPLAGIMGLAEITAAETSEDATRTKLRQLMRNAGTLNTIISDIIDMAKIDGGDVRITRRSCRTDELVEAIAAECRLLDAAEGVDLQFEVADDAPPRLVTDAARVRQILLNFLTNALKFTPRGSVSVVCRTDERGVRFAVSDTGVGIPADKLETIFERFTQVKNSQAVNVTGVGIGLAICRELAARLGGTIEVESVEGEGSRFSLVLPVGDPATGADATDEPPQSSYPTTSAAAYAAGSDDVDIEIAAGGGKPAVLIADDSEVLQLLLRHAAERAGFEVHVVKNGREALEALKEHDFSLAVLDISMPELSGHDLMRAVRGGETRSATVPLIAVTAHALPEEIAAIRESGADDVVLKPFSVDRLAEKLRSFLV